MKRIMIGMVVLMLVAVFAVGCTQSNTGSGASQSAATADSPGSACFVIKTAYGELKYPEKWKDAVVTEIADGSVYTVSFTAVKGKTPLFDLNFGGGAGYYLGTLPDNGKNTAVYVDDKKLDSKSEDYDTFCEMQEDVNVIMQNLIADYGFYTSKDKPSESEAEEVRVYEIDAPFAKLFYPEKWKDKIVTKTDGNRIDFVSDGVIVFALELGGEDGFPVGTYKGKELRLITYDFAKYESDKARFEELCAMQEDANVILVYLEKDENFKG